jgi:tetratricopeptide (TPR) repeat protein
MSKKPDKSKGDDKPAKPTFTDTEIAKARRWFEKGQELAEKKNYDYAIESYISGLAFWPEAVEEGHKPCRAAALFRGPQKVSFTGGMKYKTTGKDAKRAMLNAEMLLSKDAANIGYTEAVFKNAARGYYDQTVLWIGELLADAAVHEEKPNPARFELMRKIYEELADRVADTEPPLAITCLERAVEALSRLQALKPQDLEIATDLRDVAGKLTILKGQYQSAESFRDSIHDGDAQQELHDKERAVQSDESLDKLIASARQHLEADPLDKATINELVNLLCRREQTQEETQAIGILIEAFKQTEEYPFKMRADEIRMRQLNRQTREIVASGDAEAARKQLKDQLRYELKVYRDRADRYPTDMRIRYQYGQRLFRARRFDDAIPVLQEARSDPKTRGFCNLYIGRCFFEKGYHSQAVDTLQEAIQAHEPPDDELGKQLNYRLGRAYEADGRTEDALKTYGQLIQWDYNYRNGEVRKRLDALKTRK